jgi:hypothetical protein
VSRLRAAAFKADGEQKAKSGDLSGAMAAFDEAAGPAIVFKNSRRERPFCGDESRLETDCIENLRYGIQELMEHFCFPPTMHYG